MVKQNIFLFNFESEESKNRILEEGPCTFDRKPLVLVPSQPRLKMDMDMVQKLPI